MKDLLKMTDLLTPAKVREMLAQSVAADKPMACRLCRDYLTLWDRYEELERRYEGLSEDYTRHARTWDHD